MTKVTCLHSSGNREIAEFEIDKSTVPDNGVLVKTIMTGVCRSDIGQYAGWEKGVPLGMFGHEGLGEVVEIGKNYVGDATIGSFVSTWSDPAYADFYPAKENEFVPVPSAEPKYILQPVACGVNIYLQLLKYIDAMDPDYKGKILLLGTGFLSTVIGQAAKGMYDLTIVGGANAEIWDELGYEHHTDINDLIATGEKFKYIIDLSSKAANFDHITNSLAADEACIAYAGTPTTDITTNFFDNCWKCHTFIMPSPRNSDFNNAMKLSAQWIEDGTIDADRLWTHKYDRHDMIAVKAAFESGLNRGPGYVRGYLVW